MTNLKNLKSTLALCAIFSCLPLKAETTPIKSLKLELAYQDECHYWIEEKIFDLTKPEAPFSGLGGELLIKGDGTFPAFIQSLEKAINYRTELKIPNASYYRNFGAELPPDQREPVDFQRIVKELDAFNIAFVEFLSSISESGQNSVEMLEPLVLVMFDKLDYHMTPELWILYDYFDQTDDSYINEEMMAIAQIQQDYLATRLGYLSKNKCGARKIVNMDIIVNGKFFCKEMHLRGDSIPRNQLTCTQSLALLKAKETIRF